VLGVHAHRLPLRILEEPRQGHSHARNRAVAEARGKLVLWTDDDVLVDKHWVWDHLAAAEKHPDARFFGGPVRPWFEASPPFWVARHLGKLGYCWALLDHGPEVRWLRPGEYCFGANIAFRTEPLRRHPFDPMYGRVGKQLSSGDETRLIDQIRAEGGEGVWVGTAGVDHYLPADRMTVRYVAEINRWAGYLGYEPFALDRSARLFGAPRWAWRKYLAAAVRTAVLSRTKGDGWAAALVERSKTKGLIDRFRAERSPG
jgi:hypothetical protein